MPKVNIRSQTRLAYEADLPLSLEQIYTGCLLRIADASEAMAKNYVALQNDCDTYKRFYEREKAEVKRLRRSIAALRGLLKKHKANGGAPCH